MVNADRPVVRFGACSHILCTSQLPPVLMLLRQMVLLILNISRLNVLISDWIHIRMNVDPSQVPFDSVEHSSLRQKEWC